MQIALRQLFLDFLSAIVFLIVYSVTDNLSERFVLNAGYCRAALMFALAVANVIVATSFDFRIWGWFVSFGLIGAKLVAFFIQYGLMRWTVTKKLRAAAAASQIV